MGNLIHENIRTRNNKTRKFYYTKFPDIVRYVVHVASLSLIPRPTHPSVCHSQYCKAWEGCYTRSVVDTRKLSNPIFLMQVCQQKQTNNAYTCVHTPHLTTIPQIPSAFTSLEVRTYIDGVVLFSRLHSKLHLRQLSKNVNSLYSDSHSTVHLCQIFLQGKLCV